MQLLNVYMGGTLIQDMYNSEIKHDDQYHSIKHIEPGKLSWLGAVNSLHHQCICKLGNKSLYRSKLVAVEPVSRVAEIVTWGSNIAGFQFHPEMFNMDLGSRFFSVICNWVKGEVALTFDVNKDLLDRLRNKINIDYNSIAETINTEDTNEQE
jgi:gamma-glutamyl-gamma-aminobutyrate hydrolase PuuD